MTAEEFAPDVFETRAQEEACIKAMIEFARYHVEQALKAAYDYHTIEKHIEEEKYDYPNADNFRVNKQSIINAYPSENIK